MRVYLLNPPFVKNFIRSSRWARRAFAGSQWYPIFLAYATGFLEENGHKVKLADALASNTNIDNVLLDLKSFSPDIVVVYTSWPSLASDISLSEKIKKETGALIVFVGPWCAMNPKRILSKSLSVDVVIRKELELPLLEIANGRNLSEIRGIDWQKGGKVFENKDGDFLTNEQLDQLPFVTDVYRKHLDIKNYRQSSLKYPFVDFFTGRGCYWGQCTFCLWPHTIHSGAPRYRKRGIDNVLSELKYIKQYLPEVKEVFVQDDTLPSDRALEFSKAILKNNLKINWSCYAKPLLDYKTLAMMKGAGCRCLHVGYESADDDILRFCRKGQTVKMMERFTKDAKKAGLIIHADFIVGLPGETKETIVKTINWAKRLKLLDYQFAVLQPEENTPVYDYLKKKKYLSGKDEINYPELSSGDLSKWRIRAYHKIYLSPSYLLRLVKHPSQMKRMLNMSIKGLPNLIKKRRD